MLTEVQMRLGAIAETRAVERQRPLAEGQARFAVERFALTANNVTYAAHGRDLRYWDFYPAPDGWGIVPVWGFARVVETRCAELAVGARFYGYWPMANEAVLTPAKVRPRGFVDAAPHRRELAAVYNFYAAVIEAMGDEVAYSLFRPLFLTSFLLDASLAGKADTLVISSASSKTALGLAYAAKARGAARIVGLTSPANRAFVEATGYYDRVAGYDTVAGLDIAGSVAFADFAGNGAVRRAVHERFADGLVATLLIGDTHWEADGAAPDLPGPKPAWFFAPTTLAEQIGAEGQVAFDASVETLWQSFVASTANWLRVIDIVGAEAVQAEWREIAGGRTDPAEGVVARL